jgi:hypothetical protein
MVDLSKDMPELERLMLHRLAELDQVRARGLRRNIDYRKVGHAR